MSAESVEPVKVVKLRDAPRIIRTRIALFRGEMYEAAGKNLLYSILASKPELTMLERIENKYEPTSYTAKPGCDVDILTAETCRQIQIVYKELGLDKDDGGQPSENTGASLSGPETEQDSESAGGRERKRPRNE